MNDSVKTDQEKFSEGTLEAAVADLREAVDEYCTMEFGETVEIPEDANMIETIKAISEGLRSFI